MNQLTLMESYLNEMGLTEEYEDRINDQMYEHRKDLLESFSKIIHPSHVEAFSKFLALAWYESDKDAERLADSFNLDQKDLCALMLNFEDYKALIESQAVMNYGR